MVKYHFGYNYLTNLFTCPHDSLKNTPKCVKLTKRQTETRTCKLKITSTTITRVTVSPTRKRWHTRHPVYCLSVTVHDQHRKKAYRETPAETA